jgi:hypothetical protein
MVNGPDDVYVERKGRIARWASRNESTSNPSTTSARSATPSPARATSVERTWDVEDDVAGSPGRGDRGAVGLRADPGEPLPVTGCKERGEPRRVVPDELLDVVRCNLSPSGTPIAAEASAKSTSRSIRMHDANGSALGP